ncbi:hypothetical protein BS78_08G026700 [Paspalum vaginatum]|nr:hypothetical protein BS78_08G026700 [Paspalum vaginatum]
MAASLAGEPPESTSLRIGDDIAWSEISGVYDRDDSLKENTNPKCLLANKNHNHPGAGHGPAGSASQRLSGNLKPTAAPIIGLPGGKLGAGSARRHPPAMLLFPTSKAAPGAGRAAVLPEPASPKVSCIGRVLSERERARLRSRRGGGGDGPPPGCCGALGLGALLRRSRSRRCAVDCVDDQSPPPPEPARRAQREAAEADVEAPAPGLGGVRRFASGRRAAEWAAGMEDDGHVARSGPL